ncbi:MAG: hypothetical protein RL112_2903 [Planctomycetota bacterium]
MRRMSGDAPAREGRGSSPDSFFPRVRGLRFLSPALLAACAALLLGCRSDGTAAGAERPAPSVDPRHEAALLACEGALRDGDARLARSILARVAAQADDAGTLAAIARLSDLLDGREAAESLDLRLRMRIVRPPGDAAPGPVLLVVELEGRSLDGAPRTLSPGAAELELEESSCDEAGVERRTIERVPLQAWSLEARSEPTRVELHRARWSLAPGAKGARIVARLSLRAARVEVGGRLLACPGVATRPGFASMVERELAALGEALPSELVEVERQPSLTRGLALRVALRIPPARQREALRLLAEARDLDLDPLLELLVPACRWLCGAEVPPQDAAGVRALLRASLGP